MARHNRSKKQLIKVITQYGIHIWAILIIANAVMVYTYHFASHAASKKFLDANQGPTPSDEVSPTDVPTDIPQPTATGDPIINLTFTVPGIGSGGGVMKPIHLKRSVTVFLYATDANSLNPTVKPLYTIQGFATFDSDPTSPTYTSFINPNFDLGNAVQDGNYQVAFRTDQSLRTLIKQNPTDIGGEIINLSHNSDPIQIPSQTVLMGDIVPKQGDNVIDISDYNAFINCYGTKATSSLCQRNNDGDFDDDGVVDGVDYNILLRSLTILEQEGISVPIASPTLSHPKRISRPINHVTPTKTQKKTPTPTQATQPQKNGGSPFGIIPFIVIFILLGAGGFILYRKRDMIRALIHLSPTGTPTPETLEEKPIEEEKPADQPAKKENAAPTESRKVNDQSSQDTESTDPSSQTAGSVIEKDCYVKKKGPDETGSGMWLLLTDDNGSTQAHYAKNDAKDGFAKVKGFMKKENGKTFLEILELNPEG